MGVAKAQHNQTKQNGLRLAKESKWDRLARESARGGIDWDEVQAAALCDAVQSVLSEDLGIAFYPAAGGRGISVVVYDGNKKPKAYLGSADELNDYMIGLATPDEE